MNTHRLFMSTSTLQMATYQMDDCNSSPIYKMPEQLFKCVHQKPNHLNSRERSEDEGRETLRSSPK